MIVSDALEVQLEESSHNNRLQAMATSSPLPSYTDDRRGFRTQQKAGPVRKCFQAMMRVVGCSSTNKPATPEETESNLKQLARMLTLLREYETRFGIPSGGAPAEQQWLLQELCKRLYGSGVPIWVLGPAINIAAEGLTGLRRGVDFFLLPNSGIVLPEPAISSDGELTPATELSTRMFRMERSFCMFKMTLLEQVLFRLATFSTNTLKAKSLREENFLPKALLGVIPTATPGENSEALFDQKAMGKEILDYSASGHGLFSLAHIDKWMEREETKQQLLEGGRSDDNNGRSPVDSLVLESRAINSRAIYATCYDRGGGGHGCH